MHDVFLMVIIIVFLAVGGSVLRDYLRSERRVTANSSDSGELEEELAALRQRVQVLEEIVTDKRYNLRNEINQL